MAATAIIAEIYKTRTAESVKNDLVLAVSPLTL